MGSSGRTRYHPVDNGYEIVGGRDVFNRTLYGSHKSDDRQERFFTFAGDLPLVMGAVTDWSRHTACHYAKSGVLMSGLALTPGVRMPHFYSNDIDTSSRWFHKAEDVVAVFRNGWMEYELCQFSPWFPDAKVFISVFPLMPENGFLVHYRIETDQRIIFCAGFGGITGFIGRFEYPEASERYFHAANCEGNTVVCGKNRALIKTENHGSMWIGASFPVNVEPGDAQSLQESAPGMFLGAKADGNPLQVVKLSTPLNPGETLEGFIVTIRNENEDVPGEMAEPRESGVISQRADSFEELLRDRAHPRSDVQPDGAADCSGHGRLMAQKHFLPRCPWIPLSLSGLEELVWADCHRMA